MSVNNHRWLKTIALLEAFAILFLLAGVGFLFRKTIGRTETSPESQEGVMVETNNWKNCLLPTELRVAHGIEKFACPGWMANIYWDEYDRYYNTIKFYFYNTKEEEIQRAYLSLKHKTVAFIKGEQEYDSQGENIGEHSVLSVILPDSKEVKSLYETKVRISLETFSDLSFSPDGQYVSFILQGYEWANPFVLNIEDGSNLLKDQDVCSNRLNDLVWSNNGQYLAVHNSLNLMGGLQDCFEGVLLMDTVKESSKKIFSIEYNKVLKYDDGIKSLYFDSSSDNLLYFKAQMSSPYSVEERSYEYNILEDNLVLR